MKNCVRLRIKCGDKLAAFSLCGLCVKKSFNRKDRKEEPRKERKECLVLIRILFVFLSFQLTL
jgi:hypothetical protein